MEDKQGAQPKTNREPVDSFARPHPPSQFLGILPLRLTCTSRLLHHRTGTGPLSCPECVRRGALDLRPRRCRSGWAPRGAPPRPLQPLQRPPLTAPLEGGPSASVSHTSSQCNRKGPDPQLRSAPGSGARAVPRWDPRTCTSPVRGSVSRQASPCQLREDPDRRVCRQHVTEGRAQAPGFPTGHRRVWQRCAGPLKASSDNEAARSVYGQGRKRPSAPRH